MRSCKLRTAGYFEIEKKAKLSYKLVAIGIGFIAAGVS